MTELSGTLDGIGLFSLLNFLAGLKARGRLAIIDGELNGTLSFVDGRVVGATFGSDSGQVALDAIGLALGQGRFDFGDDGVERPANLNLEPADLQKHLEQLASERQRIMAGIPSLDAMPVSAMEGPDEQPIALDRGTLRLLLRCNGRSSVLDLAREGGLLITLKRLANLHDLKLISVRTQSPVMDEPAPEETIVLTRPAHVEMPAPSAAMAPTAEPARPPTADSNAAHPRRPWWQGQGP
jgi:hypothetical protein